ncbi:GNAT family N-acetyltransferase [Oceanobacillus indicireducens]|uniref:N-acetyltransferase n=1 Tax=Oceanobacillus indicireducens TaxID=1004261 RepID=A0A917XUK5_9BACI|nr:GNAT family N-acetyltransferase [Oceanobacillus indicireducens]GGN54265.1 N-acetyltransferase [Oceanobacillus indicireducens]
MVKIMGLTNDEQFQQAATLYEEIWKDNDHSIEERIQKHSSYSGFRGLAILSNEGSMIGFSYGYTSLPTQFYHNLLAEELNALEYQRWLKDCFEFVELAIHPSYRNRGFARLLATKLVEAVENKTAILTTQVDNHPARTLYKSLGWKDIKEPFFPGNSKQAYVIMGKEL